MGGRRPDDRDHYAQKRLDLAGPLLGQLFRKLFRKLSKDVQRYGQKCIDDGKEFSPMSAVRHKTISNGLKYALATGNWGQQKSWWSPPRETRGASPWSAGDTSGMTTTTTPASTSCPRTCQSICPRPSTAPRLEGRVAGTHRGGAHEPQDEPCGGLHGPHDEPHAPPAKVGLLRLHGGGCTPSKPTGSLAAGSASVKLTREGAPSTKAMSAPSVSTKEAHDAAPEDVAVQLAGQPSKFASEVPTMLFGGNDDYRGGLLARIGQPVRSVREEFDANEGGRWRAEYEYVVQQPAMEVYPSSKGNAPNPEDKLSYTRDLGHGGKRLDDFWLAQPQRDAADALSRAEIAVTRLYTGPWFQPINFYLRYQKDGAMCCTSAPYHLDDRFPAYDARRLYLDNPKRPGTCKLCGAAEGEHRRQQLDSWATSAALLYSGIVKLADAASFATVYRGVKEVHVRLPDAFTKADVQGFAGGVELGAMSTTTDERVAQSYMGDDAGALFELSFSTQVRGADLAFLSQYPAEREMLFPPGTSLTCTKVAGLTDNQRKLTLTPEYIRDTKLAEVVAPIRELDYSPHDPLRELLRPLDFTAEL